MTIKHKPQLQLIGQDGNAVNLIGRAVRAGRKAGWSPTQVDWFIDQCKSGDYSNVLSVIQTHFDVY